LVKREVTRVVSPGTVTDQDLLDPRLSNYLASIFQQPTPKNKKYNENEKVFFGVAWIDLSTGSFVSTVVKKVELVDLMTRLNPKEVLFCDAQDCPDRFFAEPPLFTSRPGWSFGFEKATSNLCYQFQTKNLEGFGFGESDQLAIQSAGAILEYLKETQRSNLGHVDRLLPFRQNQFLEIDQATWNSLEIAQTSRSHTREGSLLGTIDRTKTSMGARMLGSWISAPLVNTSEINTRLDAVQELVENPKLRQQIREFLSRIYDVQRLLAKISTGRTSPRDVSCVGQTLDIVPQLKSCIAEASSKLVRTLHADLDPCTDLSKEIDRALVGECPPHTKDGGYIKKGYHEALDQLRELAEGGKSWIAEYQEQISNSSGIPNLKVGFNRVFGYYIEITQSHRDKVPADFIRKQTLKNAERYITPELKEYEEKILNADERSRSLEQELFHLLRELLRSYVERLKSNSQIIATLDVLASLAELASRQNYCRPEISENIETNICEARHPVLDVIEPIGTFIPNTTSLNGEDGLIHLITGPNMAGKSTYIRQVALLTIMAQMGSFLPAESATIGIADKIFARVGASDELSRGQSTFMVEMSETARILNTATGKSLVILDEIGRGTSTYDGVSLAWAIVEYLHDQLGCRTLFATHYHELTSLEKSLQYVRNFNVAVKEWQDKIVFLHKIVSGSADKSYGIHVSRLAGVPSWVNSRAESILDKLESDSDSQQISIDASSNNENSSANGVQMTLFEMVEHPLIEKIKRIDPNHVTPIDALQMIGQWKQELEQALVKK